MEFIEPKFKIGDKVRSICGNNPSCFEVTRIEITSSTTIWDDGDISIGHNISYEVKLLWGPFLDSTWQNEDFLLPYEDEQSGI